MSQTNNTTISRIRSGGKPLLRALRLQQTGDEHVRHRLAVRVPVLAVILRAACHVAEVAMHDHSREKEDLRGDEIQP